MPFYGIQSTCRAEIREIWCLPGISVMEKQPFCQSQRSLLHSRLMKDGSQHKHVCQQIRVSFSCECTGKHRAVIPCCSLAPFPKTCTFRAHPGENTDNARTDLMLCSSPKAQRLWSQCSLLCPCSGHAVYIHTAQVSLLRPDADPQESPSCGFASVLCLG